MDYHQERGKFHTMIFINSLPPFPSPDVPVPGWGDPGDLYPLPLSSLPLSLSLLPRVDSLCGGTDCGDQGTLSASTTQLLRKSPRLVHNDGVERWVSRESSIQSSLRVISYFFADCKRHLAEPGLRLITPTVHLLRAIADASDPACTYVVSSVLPSLIQQATLETQVAYFVHWLSIDSWCQPAIGVAAESGVRGITDLYYCYEPVHRWGRWVMSLWCNTGILRSLSMCSHHASCEQQKFYTGIADVSKHTWGVINPSGCHNNTWRSSTNSWRFRKVRGELTKAPGNICSR